jgi:hypothetical protein
MPLHNPGPYESKHDLCWAGEDPHRKSGFAMETSLGRVLTVPPEWRVPLAAHLLAGTGVLLGRDSVAALRSAASRLDRVRGKGRTAANSESLALRRLALSFECLVQEMLESDPETSTRPEYRPEYYVDRQHRLVSEGVLEIVEERKPKPEEFDDTPAPWEPF